VAARGVVGGLDTARRQLSLRHEARGTFIHKKRVITARCYGCVEALLCLELVIELPVACVLDKHQYYCHAVVMLKGNRINKGSKGESL
jgi:hypothetical protein